MAPADRDDLPSGTPRIALPLPDGDGYGERRYHVGQLTVRE